MATNNRYRPRETRDRYYRILEAAEKQPLTVVFCDTETGGIHAFVTSGEEFDRTIADIKVSHEEDDIFLDGDYEPTFEDKILASAITGDDLLQFSAVKCLLKYERGRFTLTELNHINLFIQNRSPIDAEASKVNHITEDSLAEWGAKCEKESFPIIRDFLADCDVFMAYNEPFDFDMIDALYIRNGADFAPPFRFDVMAMAIDCISMYKCQSKKLGDIAKYLGVIDGTETFHDALDDIRVTVKVFEALRQQFEDMPTPTDTCAFRTPRIQRHWVWQNPNMHKMIRIYFQTDCGKIFMEKLDRSFGTDGTYSINELNMEGFIKNVLTYFKVERLEDLVHMKIS